MAAFSTFLRSTLAGIPRPPQLYTTSNDMETIRYLGTISNQYRKFKRDSKVLDWLQDARLMPDLYSNTLAQRAAATKDFKDLDVYASGTYRRLKTNDAARNCGSVSIDTTRASDDSCSYHGGDGHDSAWSTCPDDAETTSTLVVESNSADYATAHQGEGKGTALKTKLEVANDDYTVKTSTIASDISLLFPTCSDEYMGLNMTFLVLRATAPLSSLLVLGKPEVSGVAFLLVLMGWFAAGLHFGKDFREREVADEFVRSQKFQAEARIWEREILEELDPGSCTHTELHRHKRVMQLAACTSYCPRRW